MTERPQTKIVVLKETFLQSLARDTFTFVMLISTIGIGVFLESAALQWIGAIFALLTIFTKASMLAKKMTIPEARAYLDELAEKDATK